MRSRKIDVYDHLKQHCRNLGHRISFDYCRRLNSGLPCSNIILCWRNIFPIDEFVRTNYTHDEIVACIRPSEPKIVQIYELMKEAVEKAKRKPIESTRKQPSLKNKN